MKSIELFDRGLVGCPVIGYECCGFYQKEKELCHKYGDPISIRTKRDKTIRTKCPAKRGKKTEQPEQIDWVGN